MFRQMAPATRMNSVKFVIKRIRTNQLAIEKSDFGCDVENDV